ncbi:MAG: PilZ domain-containing protein [Polyangia bacterium]
MAMRFLRAKFQGQSDFLQSYQSDAPTGGLFVATTQPIAADENVIVELVCDGLPNKVLIRGSVTEWRPALPRLRVRAGATVVFHAGEAEKRHFVLRTLAGEASSARRKHVRIPVQLRVNYRLVGSTESQSGELLEISVGGALLGGVVMKLGTELVLDLVPPGGAAKMEIAGRVSYHTPGGSGLRFVYRDGGGSRRLRELIRRICVS